MGHSAAATRTILLTGKGGVGKTSVAACTARRCAARGLRTLVLSTDPAHSLSDSLEADLGAEPTEIGQRLWAQEVRAQDEMERHWSGVREWLGGLLVERGIDRLTAEELTVPPGMDELFSLLRIESATRSGEWDVLVVDCAPTGETLRLLSFPDVAQWWLDKVLPSERRLMAAAGPIARSLLDIPLPGAEALGDLRRLSENLIEMNGILRDRARTTIRLVMTPDRMVIAEAMRTFTYLGLYGFLTDAIVVNRVLPKEVGDYFEHWRKLQRDSLERVRAAFAPVPVLTAPYFGEEVVGAERLDQLAAALFGEEIDPAAVLHDSITHAVSVDGDRARLRLALPFAEKGEIALRRIGPELIVTVGGQRRTMILPSALAGLRPAGATLEDGTLEILFDAAERPL